MIPRCCGHLDLLHCLFRAVLAYVTLGHRCLDNVKDGKSVAPSLRLMQRIIDAQPESPSNASSSSWGSAGRVGNVRCKDEILEMLDRECRLLKLLVDVSGAS